MTQVHLHEAFRLANDPTTSVEQLTLLAEHEDESIRGAVAMNASSTHQVLLVLQQQPESEHVRYCLALRAGLLVPTPAGQVH